MAICGALLALTGSGCAKGTTSPKGHGDPDATAPADTGKADSGPGTTEPPGGFGNPPTMMTPGDMDDAGGEPMMSMPDGSLDSGTGSDAGDAAVDSGFDSGYGNCNVDGNKNGDESGEDCGGPDCPKCPEGEGCVLNADCESLNCDTGFICAAPSCTDLRTNGKETDVDCGGPDCGPCGSSKGCEEDGDCDSGDCQADMTCKCVAKTTNDCAATDCGTIDDTCGGMVTCPDVCAANGTSCIDGVCCAPRLPGDCGANECDLRPDGCGGQVDCIKSCPGSTVCGGDGLCAGCDDSLCPDCGLFGCCNIVGECGCFFGVCV